MPQGGRYPIRMRLRVRIAHLEVVSDLNHVIRSEAPIALGFATEDTKADRVPDTVLCEGVGGLKPL